jgi:peptidoglycan/xylan/chitin deacetylase (PgdA/CDA1 family)
VSDVLVLCYHAVSERWSATLSIRPAQLREQLELLARRGYRATTFSEAVSGRHAGRLLAVTFDDAFHSVYRLARPILAELRIPATVFVPTDFADEERALCWAGVDHWLKGPDRHEMAVMSWRELGELVSEGWEVGSHTRTHPRLTALEESSLADELRGSREACERALGGSCPSLAYPYGDVDDRVVRAARDAGYRAAAALPARLYRPTPLRWPRIGVYNGDRLRRFQLKVSPTVRRGRLMAALARGEADGSR